MDTFRLLYDPGISSHIDIGRGNLERPQDMPTYPSNPPQRNSGREIVVTLLCGIGIWVVPWISIPEKTVRVRYSAPTILGTK